MTKHAVILRATDLVEFALPDGEVVSYNFDLDHDISNHDDDLLPQLKQVVIASTVTTLRNAISLERKLKNEKLAQTFLSTFRHRFVIVADTGLGLGISVFELTVNKDLQPQIKVSKDSLAVGFLYDFSGGGRGIESRLDIKTTAEGSVLRVLKTDYRRFKNDVAFKAPYRLVLLRQDDYRITALGSIIPCRLP